MEEREIHLRDYFRTLIKRRYIFFTFFAVAFVFILLWTFSTTPLYMATTKVLIEKSGAGDIPVSNFYYMPYDPDYYETQYQLIKSTSVARRVVKMLSLEKTYESYFADKNQGFNIISNILKWFKHIFSLFLHIGGVNESQNGTLNNNPGSEELSIKADRIARVISGSIRVEPLKDSRLVNISYMSTDPELAADVVNSVAKAYMDEILEMKMSSSSYAIQWLTKKADEERINLEKSEKALQAYMRDQDIVTLENRLAIVPEKLSEVATKIAMAETKRKEMESLYNKVRELRNDLAKADTIPAIGSDPTVQSLREQIMKSEQKIMDMSKKYGKKHPAMQTALGDLKVLKQKKEEEIKRVIATIKNEYELARANEENFRKLTSQTKDEMLSLNEKFIQYEALKRENETNRQLFDAIIKKIKEQGITQDIQTVDVWVVEKAGIPGSPAKPNKPLYILLGLGLSLIGSIGLAFFVEYLDNTIKSPDDTEAKLGIPVLGTIQLFRDEGAVEKVILEKPKSVIVEGYKALRTAILLSTSDKPPKNILITSVEPAEGKTATALNLAMTIAQSEYSVLLVDADLRKSVIHKQLGLDNSKGLSTVLAGASDDDIIFKGPIDNLHIIPSGPIPPNPSELLGSKKMIELVKMMNEKFDIIIWDSAPLFAVSDSHILSNIVDGTIIIARAGRTTYEAVRKGLKILYDIKSHVLGIVINAVDARKSGYYYNKYYNYSYSSDEETE